MNPVSKIRHIFFDRTFLKFIFVGIINTIVGTSIMFALYNLAGCGYWISSATNYFLTSIMSFFINKYFTFRMKNWSMRMIIAFVMNIIAAYLVAYSVAKPMTYYALQDYSETIRDNVSMFVGMCLFTCLNYVGQRFMVFRSVKGKKDGE